MNQDFSMHANPLVAKLQKPASEFTKADIVSYIKENEITMVNFMYPAADGRLKTLNFVINDAAYLDAILTCGERVDGSSLFPFIEAVIYMWYPVSVRRLRILLPSSLRFPCFVRSSIKTASRWRAHRNIPCARLAGHLRK